MFHPFKRLETAWNARTPVFLHNRTKENLIFQLIMAMMLILGMYAKDKYDERQETKRWTGHKNFHGI